MASDAQRPLRLLSLDGGGVRGLSSLLILRHIMHNLKEKQNLDRTIKPCEYFDMIAGTSTGGLIAIMLGTLRMSVEECISAYQDFAPKIFPKEGFISGNPISKSFKALSGKARFNGKVLEEEVKKLVENHVTSLGLDRNAIFDKINWPGEVNCHVVVCAGIPHANTAIPLRSYSSRLGSSPGCTVWQAARATSAAPLFFDPISFGNPPMVYIDGALRYNNPVRVLYDEAQNKWKDRSIGCIISIGTGRTLPYAGSNRLDKLLRSMKQIVTDTEQTEREFANDIYRLAEDCRPGYFRWNVENGLEKVKLEEWKDFPKLTAVTEAYLGGKRREVDECVATLLSVDPPDRGEHNEPEKVEWNPQECKCQQTLLTSEYERYKARNPNRIEGTCQWFLKHQSFQAWQQSNVSSILWVSADPGCGKSVLSRSLVERELKSTKLRTTCYFFFKDDAVAQKSITNALSALLHQLFEQKRFLIHHALPVFESEGEKLPQSFSKLWNILTNAACDPEAGEVICILDALDECEESGRYDIIKALSEFYKSVNTTTGKPSAFKFLATSRPYLDIERRFKQLTNDIPTVRLRGEEESEIVSEEINLVINFKVHKEIGPELELDESEKFELENELSHITHRTYLWVTLVFDVIRRHQTGVTTKKLKKLISKLPDTVEKAYEAILEKSSDTAHARKLLCIVLAATRPLTVKEMNIALAIEAHHRSYQDLDLEPDKRFEVTVRSLCGLFISIVDQKIYLIHQTAKEFLLADRAVLDGGWKQSISPIESELVIARTCIGYLEFHVFNYDPLVSDKDLPRWDAARVEKAKKYEEKHGYLNYASQFWPIHYRRAESRAENELLNSVLEICNIQNLQCQTWYQIYQHYLDFTPAMPNMVIMGSYFGLETVVQQLLNSGDFDVDQTDKNDRTALHWAASEGHEAVVKLLLESRAEIDTKDRHGDTALILAASEGHEAIVKLLLDAGAEVDAKDNDGDTAIIFAASDGHEAVVKLLLEAGAEVDAKNKYGNTALILAASNGHEAVVKLLLDAGAEVDGKNNDGYTALSLATDWRQEAVVKLLESRM